MDKMITWYPTSGTRNRATSPISPGIITRTACRCSVDPTREVLTGQRSWAADWVSDMTERAHGGPVR
jgi:hypothetical protein